MSGEGKSEKSEDEGKYRNPALAASAVIPEGEGIVLVRRSIEPFKGMWCLPGGFVEYGERVEDTIIREVKEETGLDVEPVKVFGVYSKPDRDPRKHVVDVPFLVKKVGGEMKPSPETSEVRVFNKIRAVDIAFDHADIIRGSGYGMILE